MLIAGTFENFVRRTEEVAGQSVRQLKIFISRLVQWYMYWRCGYCLLQEGMLSHEEAIVARQNLIKENQSKVAEIKEQVSKNVRGNNMKYEQPRVTT